jgi:membrane protein
MAAGEADRGRDAARPAEIPLRGWRDIAIRAWREAGSDNIELIAAGVASTASSRWCRCSARSS